MTDIEVMNMIPNCFDVRLVQNGSELIEAHVNDIMKNMNIKLGNEAVAISPVSERCIQIIIV